MEFFLLKIQVQKIQLENCRKTARKLQEKAILKIENYSCRISAGFLQAKNVHLSSKKVTLKVGKCSCRISAGFRQAKKVPLKVGKILKDSCRIFAEIRQGESAGATCRIVLYRSWQDYFQLGLYYSLCAARTNWGFAANT